MEANRLLDVSQAAQQLNVSPLTLRAWIRQRRLTVVRLGRRVLLDSKDLQEYIDKHRVPARAAKGL